LLNKKNILVNAQDIDKSSNFQKKIQKKRWKQCMIRKQKLQIWNENMNKNVGEKKRESQTNSSWCWATIWVFKTWKVTNFLR
jgi:hypothetical protein